ncbi:hypothetical protein S245_051825, partial [Arachis hypogaea]
MPSPSSSRLAAVIIVFSSFSTICCLLDSTSRGAFSYFYSDKGRVLSEEEHAKENVYIKVSLPSLFLSPSPSSKPDSNDFFVQKWERKIRERKASRFSTPISGFFSNVFLIFLVLLQFEDFTNHNAFDLLAKYNIASVVLAGFLASLKLVRGTLADHTFLLLGARE